MKYFNKTTVLLILILLLAAFFRLYRINEYMEFLGDEGRDVIVARDIIHGQFTLLGPRSSAGDFYMGPFYYYLIAPFLLFANFDPVGPAIMVALFGVLSVFLIYYVGKKLFNLETALFAAALYSVSPLVLAYSHSSWNPDILPFFSLLLIYTTYYAVKNQKGWRHYMLIGIILGLCLQLHYLSLFLAVVIFVYLFIAEFTQLNVIARRNDEAIPSSTGLPRSLSVARNDKKSRKRLEGGRLQQSGSHDSFKVVEVLKKYLIITVGAIISLSPFILFEFRHDFLNTRGILVFLFGNTINHTPSANFFETQVQVFFRIFARLIFDFPANIKAVNLPLWQLVIWGGISLILAVASIIVLFKQKNKHVSILLSLWLFISVFLFGFYRKEIYDYLFTLIFPLPFLLVGNLLGYIYGMPKQRPRVLFLAALSLILFGIIFVINLLNSPFRIQANNQRDQTKKIAEFVILQTDNKPYNFALLSKGNSDYAYRYYLDILNRPPVILDNLENDPLRKSVTGQLLIVCEDIKCKPIGNPLHDVAAFGQPEIVNEWNVSVVKVYKLKHYLQK